jgi:hypothetical protein
MRGRSAGLPRTGHRRRALRVRWRALRVRRATPELLRPAVPLRHMADGAWLWAGVVSPGRVGVEPLRLRARSHLGLHVLLRGLDQHAVWVGMGSRAGLPRGLAEVGRARQAAPVVARSRSPRPRPPSTRLGSRAPLRRRPARLEPRRAGAIARSVCDADATQTHVVAPGGTVRPYAELPDPYALTAGAGRAAGRPRVPGRGAWRHPYRSRLPITRRAHRGSPPRPATPSKPARGRTAERAARFGPARGQGRRPTTLTVRTPLESRALVRARILSATGASDGPPLASRASSCVRAAAARALT